MSYHLEPCDQTRDILKAYIKIKDKIKTGEYFQAIRTQYKFLWEVRFFCVFVHDSVVYNSEREMISIFLKVRTGRRLLRISTAWFSARQFYKEKLFNIDRLGTMRNMRYPKIDDAVECVKIMFENRKYKKFLGGWFSEVQKEELKRQLSLKEEYYNYVIADRYNRKEYKGFEHLID